MNSHYITVRGIPTAIDDIEEWGRFMASEKKLNLENQVKGVFVSTVFLGVNHQFEDGPPLFWETMLFNEVGESIYNFCRRYESEREAILGHFRTMALLYLGEDISKLGEDE